jgi:hypothetical protein
MPPAKGLPRSGQPGRTGEARIFRRDAKARDDRMSRRGDDAEQHGVRLGHLGPGTDDLHLLGGDRAEEEIGDVPLENQVMAVRGQDALDDAGHADDRPQAMAAEIDENQGQVAHGRT